MGVVGLLFVAGYAAFPLFAQTHYEKNIPTEATAIETEETKTAPVVEEPKPEPPLVTHMKEPEVLKAIYMSSWVGGDRKFRAQLVGVSERTEINAIVIDIKDYSGKIAFHVADPWLESLGSTENRIPDIREFINYLHSKNIFVIGRIATFQDPHWVKLHPELAVKTMTDKNAIWKDRKGITWLDAGAKETWDYMAKIGIVSYKEMGFDEINYDYIRFPSDGNMKDIYYPYSNGKIKSEVMEEFFTYVGDALHKENIPVSADLFGMVTTNTDDLGIGQLLEGGLKHFDYIYPMVYPSHFPPTWNGYANPAAHPYEVILYTMQRAKARAEAIGLDPNKIRPWLQDFNLGATYTADMVRKQITATNDAGLSSWLLWDAANTYTEAALKAQ